MKNIYKVAGLIALIGTLFSGNVFAQSIDEIISNERARAIARGISDSVVGAVIENVDESAEPNPGSGGSADGNSFLPDAVWTNSSWTEISEDNLAANIDADIYQFSLGTDKRFGDFFVGVSTTYAYTETEISGIGSQGHTHTINVTPYVAYVINKNFFVTVLSGYSYSRSEPDVAGFNGDSDSDEYSSELSFNGIKAIDNFFIKGKTGFRYRHTATRFDSALVATPTIDNWTFLGDVEVGYTFAKGLKGFAGALYEYTDAEKGEDDGVLYMSTGIDYSVNDKFIVGIKYSTDVNNEDVDINTIGLNMRLAL